MERLERLDRPTAVASVAEGPHRCFPCCSSDESRPRVKDVRCRHPSQVRNKPA